VREDTVIYMSPGGGWTDYASVPLTQSSQYSSHAADIFDLIVSIGIYDQAIFIWYHLELLPVPICLFHSWRVLCCPIRLYRDQSWDYYRVKGIDSV
jgi:hypothetical protein